MQMYSHLKLAAFKNLGKVAGWEQIGGFLSSSVVLF